MAHLVLVVVTPSATLLAVATTVARATEAALAVAVLAGLVALASGVLTAKGTKATVLAARLAAVQSMLLLKVAWVTAVALLSRLWWWERRLAWSSVGRRSWTSSLGHRWAWTVGSLSIAKGLQVVSGALLAALSELLALPLVRGTSSERVHGAEATATSKWLSTGLLRSGTTVVTKTSTNSALTTVKGGSREWASCWGSSVVVCGLWRHAIAVLLVVHAALSVWTSAVVALAAVALVVAIHVSGVVWAVIVRAVWILLSATWLALWLSWDVWLSLRSRLSSSLLRLCWWVWSGVSTVLSLAGSCVSRLSCLRCGLWEWGRNISYWSVVTAESTLRSWTILLGLCALLLSVLGTVIVLVGLTLLLVGSVVLRVLAWGRGESTRLGLLLSLVWLARVAVVLAWCRWGLLREWVVWLLAKG